MQAPETEATGETDPQTCEIGDRLRAEHAQLVHLAQRAMAATEPEKRSDFARSLRVRWLAHANAEEACVYRSFEGRMEVADCIHIGREEQAWIDQLVGQLVRRNPAGDDWREHTEVVNFALEAHTRNEALGLLARLPGLVDELEDAYLSDHYAQLCADSRRRSVHSVSAVDDGPVGSRGSVVGGYTATA